MLLELSVQNREMFAKLKSQEGNIEDEKTEKYIKNKI